MNFIEPFQRKQHEYLIKFHAWVPEVELAEDYKDLIADYWDDVNAVSFKIIFG